MTSIDPRLMQRALQLAERGWGWVHPNPLVGAVVARGDQVIAEGWHTAFGAPHAEVMALAAAGEAARGATLYVTLEPCSHHGQTPPCTDAILQAGVARVVVAAADPNPEAQGGAARLRAAGVDVIEGVEAAAARRLNAAFMHWHEQGTPWVALKLALTLDGAVGLERGPRVMITGEPAREQANRLRAGFDAVLVGARTALRDDPSLTVRSQPVRVQPARVVLDSAARLTPDARLLQTVAEAPVLVLTDADAPAEHTSALRRAGAEIVTVSRSPTGLDLNAVLAALAARNIRSVLVEGGAQVARAFLEADRVRRLYLFIAPRMQGAGALRAFEPWPLARPSSWRLISNEPVGEDLALVLERGE